MALTIVQNPTFAGLTEAAKRVNNQLALQVFHKPVWDEIFFSQAPKWWLTPFLEEYAGEMEPITANEFNWMEDGKIYKLQTINTVTGTFPTFTVEFTDTTQYFVLYDVVDLGIAIAGQEGINVLGRVTAVGTNGANQTITVEIIDPQGVATGLTTTDFTAGDTVALLYNTQGECFQKPQGRIRSPERFTNQLNKVANTYDVCDDAQNQGIWFKNSVNGKFYWTDEEERMTMRLHAMQCDMASVFGQNHSFTETGTSYDGVGGTGLIPYLSYGSLIGQFAGTLVEQDLSDMLSTLSTHSDGTSWTVLAGVDFIAQAQVALKDYHQQGAIAYGRFAPEGGNHVGLNVTKYTFAGKTLKMMEYKGFSDPDFLPNNTNGTNYKNLAMFLNLEDRDCIKMVYKKRKDGGKMKKYLNNMPGIGGVSPGSLAVQDRACRSLIMTSHLGIQMKGLNKHGMMIGV